MRNSNHHLESIRIPLYEPALALITCMHRTHAEREYS